MKTKKSKTGEAKKEVSKMLKYTRLESIVRSLDAEQRGDLFFYLVADANNSTLKKWTDFLATELRLSETCIKEGTEERKWELQK